MTFSLRRRLLVLLISITAGIWAVTAVTGYQDSRHEVRELFDAQMAQTARTLLSVAGHELIELSGGELDNTHIHFTGETRFTAGGHEYEYKLAYQLWQQPQNTLLLRSFNAPERPLGEKLNGYSIREINGERWRVFSLLDEDSGFQVQVGEAMAIREELSSAVAMRIGLSLIIALPLLTLLISLGVTRTLSPLRRLAEAIIQRDPDNLDKVDEKSIPEEVIPLVKALNRLFERLACAFENERRFTADAAHELRTPLAALKVQAQVARRSRDDHERNQALDSVLKGVDRASALVEQLLTLARIDPENHHAPVEMVDLERIAANIIADDAGQARQKRINVALNSCSNPKTTGMREGIEVLLRNLLDNAIRYTPEGGQVSVSIERSEGRCLILRIGDSGPGVPKEEREKIFERFYRLAGQDTPGSGLGLSIVKRIAELNHAELSLGDSPLGGLEVSIRFLCNGD
ncbi:MAG: ATP-binding protein [Pseudomonadota bacterium]